MHETAGFTQVIDIEIATMPDNAPLRSRLPSPEPTPMPSSSEPPIWPLRDGPVVPVALVERLLDLERRGVSFDVIDDAVAVTPVTQLTDDDKDFLRAHRDDVRRIVDYCDTVNVEHLR